MSKVRLRFAPSPTGYLHIGGLRTALFNYLYARHMDGDFILRIEDTDQTRYVEGAVENLIRTLKWAGLDYDEGIMLDENGNLHEEGEYGPYVQSDRVKEGIYDKYINQLLDEGKAYYCFCSQDRLDNLRKQQLADGLTPKYDGLCRSLSREEAEKRVKNGEDYVIRLKLPNDTDISFEDQIKGKITFNTNDMDDQVLIKSDGFPTYHFAVVVDDHLMGITHVVRGDEWVSSTPKHIFLYDAFGWDKPQYVHLPPVLGKDKKKLSKRQGDVSVEGFVEKGYTQAGLINYIALLGWSPKTNTEILSMDDLIEQFDFDRVNKTGGIFDLKKLDWVNGQYIREMDLEELKESIKPYLLEASYINEGYDDEKLLLVADTWQTNMEKFSEIVDLTKNIFIDIKDVEFGEEEGKFLSTDDAKLLEDSFLEELDKVSEVDMDFCSSIMKTIQTKTGIKGKNLWFPLRAALTGNVSGPEMKNILYILGKDEMVKRLNFAKENF